MASAFLQARQANTMSEMHLHPPYPPTTASLGGLPTVGVDVPICAVFLVLYIIGAASHMTIFRLNTARGHKFVISGMLFGFCMSRIMTMILRIVWAVYSHNTRLAIAASIFVYAGVVLLFVVNIIFAQRIIRACHPNAGWHPIFNSFFTAIYVIIVLSLIALITSVIQTAYTLNLNTKRIDRDIQLYGQTLYAVISFLPIPLVIAGLVIPRKTRVEKFGSGRFRHKIAILLLSSLLLCAGASFRIGVNFAGGKRPITDPANYQDKACFYIFNFTVEIIVIYLYVLVRVDRRFHVPNKSHGPGDYSRKSDGTDIEKGGAESMHIATEEETFDNNYSGEQAQNDSEKGRALDEEKAISSSEASKQEEAPAAAPNGEAISSSEEIQHEEASAAVPN